MEQLAIAALGVTAIYLTQQSNEALKKYGCLFGLASQPFWVYSAIKADQFGILILCIFYTYAWGVGVYNNWLSGSNP